MHNLMKLAAVAAMSLFALPVLAVPFSTTMADAIGPIPSSFLVRGFTSPGSSSPSGATFTFDLLGYGGIDGFGPRISQNDVFDNFGLNINGVSLLNISMAMGGSNGSSGITGFIDPSVTIVSYTDNGSFLGGLMRFSVAHTLLSGDNSYVFNYGLQPSTGEGWGVRNMVVSADLSEQPPVAGVTGVPEPASLALMGLGLAGLVAARKRKAA